MNIPNPLRDRSIDIARMVAAFLIVLYHAAQCHTAVGGPDIAGHPPWMIAGTIPLWGRVPFFFFLSGCFSARSISNSSPDWWPFARKRLIALGIPYLFWNLVSWFMLVIAAHQGASLQKEWDITPGNTWMQLTGFGMSPANGPLWFVRDLILVSCIAPLLYRLGPWLLLPCLALTTIPEPSAHLLEAGCPLPSSLGYFGLGMMFRYLPKGLFNQCFPKPGVGLLACLAAGVSCLVFDVKPPALVGPAIGAGGIFLAGQFINQSLPGLARWMSENAGSSFLIFAANVPFFAVIKQVYLKAAPPGSPMLWLGALAVGFFACGALTHRLFRNHLPKLLLFVSGGR